MPGFEALHFPGERKLGIFDKVLSIRGRIAVRWNIGTVA